ncbi:MULTISPECIES: hypothetical protein [unclassified Bradyrhizobium]
MAETIGLLLLAPLTGTAGIAGLGGIAGTTVFGIGLPTIVGGAAIIGASIGLQYALGQPNLPKAQDGSQAIKQAIPPRIRGYGINRLAGYYMLFEANGPPPNASFDALALHSGKVDAFIGFYLSDDPVITTSDISHGGQSLVTSSFSDGRYGSFIKVETAVGNPSQGGSPMLYTDPLISTYWTVNHRGDGIAWATMVCGAPPDPQVYSRIFPKGHPELSVLTRCSLVWDPRDGTQSPTNEATWKFSRNPVLHLIDYLTKVDGGMGLDRNIILPPATLAKWMIEANLCDAAVLRANGSAESRYQADGWYRFTNNPEDVINSILATCDGWLTEAGDGTLALTVGVYRAPTDPPLTGKHILGFSLNYGQADEQLVNVLDISFTDPNAKYVEVDLGQMRDEESISDVGIERPKPLSLSWVQSFSQASRLGFRAMQRLNPEMTGTFTTTLYGLRYLGKRWVPLQYPFIAGLEDCVVEIQNADVDLLGGRIVWSFNVIDPDRIEAYNPAIDELPQPAQPPLIT